MQPQEFSNMQQKAAEYAKQMQKMASIFNDKDTKISDINHIYTNEEKNNYSSRQNQGFKNIFSSSNQAQSRNDNDLSLILALILLLSSDTGDKMLMLALLYIMT